MEIVNLQTVAARMGIRNVRYPNRDNHLKSKDKDLSHPYMTSDFSKVHQLLPMCTCLRWSSKQFVLSMAGRGFDSHIVKGIDQSFYGFGLCELWRLCPKRVLPVPYPMCSNPNPLKLPKLRTICTYCGVGCNLDVATKTMKILSITAPYDAEVNQGHTCLKAVVCF